LLLILLYFFLPISTFFYMTIFSSNMHASHCKLKADELQISKIPIENPISSKYIQPMSALDELDDPEK